MELCLVKIKDFSSKVREGERESERDIVRDIERERERERDWERKGGGERERE